jgi:integrase
MPKGYKLYSWKHTGATTLHNSNTVSLHELMQQLGHSKLSSTEHYIKKQAGIVNTRIRDHFPSPI